MLACSGADHRPDLGQHGGIIAAVVGLRAEHQERRAVDDQRVTAGAMLEVGQGSRLSSCGHCRERERRGDKAAVNVKRPTHFPDRCIARW